MAKKVFKKISIFLISLCLLFSTSYAESVKKNIDVYYDNIKIFINDLPIDLKDGNGKTVEPFIFDGTTYIPVRTVAEALGKEVTWDEATKSVHITDNENMVWLNDLAYYNLLSDTTVNKCFRLENNNFKDSSGNICSKAIKYEIYYGWIYTDYVINKKYSKINGKFVLSFDSKDTAYKATLKLYGDGKLLYTSPELTGGVPPIDFDVDISGVEILRIAISNNSPFGISNVNYGLIDAALHR